VLPFAHPVLLPASFCVQLRVGRAMATTGRLFLPSTSVLSTFATSSCPETRSGARAL